MTNLFTETAQEHRLLAMKYADLIMQPNGLGFRLGLAIYGLPYYYHVLSADFFSKMAKIGSPKSN